MKKTVLATMIALIAVLALAGPASAQAPNCPVDNPTYYDPDGVCPNVIDRPPAVQPTATGTLPRTGSNDSLPLAKTAIVLIGVGAALTVMASRKRSHHVPA